MMADIAKMKEQLEKMKAKIKAAESREAKKRRAEETRKKILIGAIVLEDIRRERQENKEKKMGLYITHLLNTRLTRPQDRALFGLKPEPPEPKEQSQKTDTTASAARGESQPRNPQAQTSTENKIR